MSLSSTAFKRFLFRCCNDRHLAFRDPDGGLAAGVAVAIVAGLSLVDDRVCLCLTGLERAVVTPVPDVDGGFEPAIDANAG